MLTIVRRWFNREEFDRMARAESIRVARMLADFTAERARVHCPVDSGDLRRSIHVVGESSGNGFYVIATMPYAEPVEFGYTHYLSGKRVPPVAFMRRAVRDAAREYPRLIGDARVRQGFHEGRVMGVAFRAA